MLKPKPADPEPKALSPELCWVRQPRRANATPTSILLCRCCDERPPRICLSPLVQTLPPQVLLCSLLLLCQFFELLSSSLLLLGCLSSKFCSAAMTIAVIHIIATVMKTTKVIMIQTIRLGFRFRHGESAPQTCSAPVSTCVCDVVVLRNFVNMTRER